MGKIFRDTVNGKEIEIHEVKKVSFVEGYFFDEEYNKYTFEEAYIDEKVAEVNKQCVIIIEQDMVFVLNKLTFDKQLEQYLKDGILEEIKE